MKREGRGWLGPATLSRPRCVSAGKQAGMKAEISDRCSDLGSDLESEPCILRVIIIMRMMEKQWCERKERNFCRNLFRSQSRRFRLFRVSRPTLAQSLLLIDIRHVYPLGRSPVAPVQRFQSVKRISPIYREEKNGERRMRRRSDTGSLHHGAQVMRSPFVSHA